MATRTISNAGGVWSSVSTWVEGAVPTSADDIVATATSGNLTVDVSASCRSLDLTGYVSAFTISAAIALSLPSPGGAGTLPLKLSAAMTFTNSGTLSVAPSGSTIYSVTTAGKAMGAFTVGSGGTLGTVRFADAFTTVGTVTLTSGTLDTNNQTCSWASLSSNNTNTRTLTMGTSVVTLTGTGTVISAATATAATLTVTGGQFVVNIASGTARSVSLGTVVWPSILVSGAGAGTFTLTIPLLGSTITVLAFSTARTVIVQANRTFAISTLTVPGISGQVVTFQSSSAATQWTVSKASGTVSVDYVSLRDSNATGGATFIAGSHSTDAGNNTGWTFVPAASAGQRALMGVGA